ncbi:MAG: ABC transporter ATP-binding protein [Chloroflexota bacterium]
MLKENLREKNSWPTQALRGDCQDQVMIRLSQVVKTYQSSAGKFTALAGIDLQIQRGEFVAIVGKSGSGKTTLINMLTGIDRPSAGEVYVACTPVHRLDEGQLALWRGRNMGIVFQFFQLLPTLTVLENVRLPMDFSNVFTPAERNQRAMHLLSLVGIQDYAHKLPRRLSGGQQQAAAIARSLANDPKIVVTDEPTGNLDSRTAEQVFSLLHQLAEDGKTVLMVTHDSDLARRAARTVTIVDGKIV